MSGKTATLKDIIQSTFSVSKELEALQREHQTLISRDYRELGSESESKDIDDEIEEKEFEAKLREEKMHAVNQTISVLKKGMEEAQLMIMLANYISSLEANKLKLKAQVKRLCSENNWLRKSLTESQQLLQEAEISLTKLTTDKEHLEFLHSQCSGQRMQVDLNSLMDIDTQGEETTDIKDDSPMSFPLDAPMRNIHQDLNTLDTSLEYEIPEKIKTLHQLTLQYINQGKPEVAIPLCRKAVQELERKTGRNNPDLAALLNILAVIYREQGRFKESIRVLQDTLEIRETVFGLKHPVVASTLNNLSVLHGKCGNFKTAEPFCQKALEIRQELLGPDHPDVAKQFCNLAILCSHLGRYDEVEHYYQRAIEIFQMELGPDDPNVTKTMNNLANCYLKQGKYKAAETMFKKVLKTAHVEERSNRGHRHGEEGEDSGLDRGASPQLGAPGHWHKLSPLQSPTLKDTLRCLSDTYRGQGRMEDAAELEKLTMEKQIDKTHRDHILQMFVDGSSSTEKIETKISSISTKKQGLQQKQGSKSSLSWGWVFGSRTA